MARSGILHLYAWLKTKIVYHIRSNSITLVNPVTQTWAVEDTLRFWAEAGFQRVSIANYCAWIVDRQRIGYLFGKKISARNHNTGEFLTLSKDQFLKEFETAYHRLFKS